MKLELKVNDTIQKQLNRKEAIKLVNMQSRMAASMIQGLQQKIEMVSIPLNFPTKNDVANATRINIQTEEKVDLIDEKLNDLIVAVEGLSQKMWRGEG